MFIKETIRGNFSRSAPKYNQVALTQKYAATKLCQITSPLINDGFKILDLGSGSSFIAQNLADKNVQIFETDLSLEMLLQHHSPQIFKTRCDFENLPFKDHSFDVLTSSFSLQWLNDFESNFKKFFSLLKPGGILAFCLPCDGSLTELKTASIASGCNFNFNNLPQAFDLRSTLKKCGFSENFYSEEIITALFSNGLQALKSIKDSGANYSTVKNTITKTNLAQFNNFCLKNFTTTNKSFSLSWNVSFFIAQTSL